MENRKIDLANGLDELSLDMSILKSQAHAVYDAMESSPNDNKLYVDALYGITRDINVILEKLDNITTDVYASRKAGKTNAGK